MKIDTNGRGPGEIARAARTIIEGMKGEPMDEEIDDVMTDAIWDAYLAGKESEGAKRKRRRPLSPPSEGAPSEGGRESK